jgi:hypothetical protein
MEDERSVKQKRLQRHLRLDPEIMQVKFLEDTQMIY